MASWSLLILTYSILSVTAFDWNSTNATETSTTSSFTQSTLRNNASLDRRTFSDSGTPSLLNDSIATSIDFSELQRPHLSSDDPSLLTEVDGSPETLTPSPSAGSSSSSTSHETQDLVDDDVDTSVSSIVTPVISERAGNFNATGLNATSNAKWPWDSGSSENSLDSSWRSRVRSHWIRIERESVEDLRNLPIRGCGWAGLGLFFPPLLGLFTHQTRERKKQKRKDSPQRSKKTTSSGSLLKSFKQRSPAPKDRSKRLGVKCPECPALNTKRQTQILDLEARPVLQEELVTKVEGIYARLAAVEKICTDADSKTSRSLQNENDGVGQFLENEQWKALVSLHRTLLEDHFDFFTTSQHPLASTALKGLASKYGMPARMWRHGIHSFLELLRHHLPCSREYLLSFIYLAYGMMALLFETVPAFEDTWAECLGDLARYRMAIEDDDVTDRMIWTDVARRWYTKASDRVPATGRLYHHLAILARPNQLEQLFYYTKSLSTNDPFQPSRESILTVLEPALNRQIDGSSSCIVDAYMRLQAKLFTKGSTTTFHETFAVLVDVLDNNVGMRSYEFLKEGSYIAVANCAALLDFGSGQGVLSTILSPAYLAGVRDVNSDEISEKEKNTLMFDEARNLFVGTATCLFQRIGDPNILSFVHVTLVFLKYLAAYPAAMKLFQATFPWEDLVQILNSELHILERHDGIEDGRMPDFREHGPLPEDFAMRGLYWAEDYFPEDGFPNNDFSDNSDEVKEVSRNRECRSKRVLWLARHLAEYNKWICFDKINHQFFLPRPQSAWAVSPEVAEMAEREIALRASDVDMTGVSNKWLLGGLQTEEFCLHPDPYNENDIFDQFMNPLASPPTTPPSSNFLQLSQDQDVVDIWSIADEKRDFMELHPDDSQGHENPVSNYEGPLVVQNQRSDHVDAVAPVSEDSAAQALNRGLTQSQILSNSATELEIPDTLMKDLENREFCLTELPFFGCVQFSRSFDSIKHRPLLLSPKPPPTIQNAPQIGNNPSSSSHMYCTMGEVSAFQTIERAPSVNVKQLTQQPACPSPSLHLAVDQPSPENCIEQNTTPRATDTLQASQHLDNIAVQDGGHEMIQTDDITSINTPPTTTQPNDLEDPTFTCTYCYKHFPRKCDLNKHIPTHTRPYQCSTTPCTRAFATQKDLDRHISDRHSNNQQSFLCRHPDCIDKGRSFKRKDNRNKHWRRAHGRSLEIGEE